MNMIIGPNGTGKSTFVAAIALGLGHSPNVLGRSKNVTEFIKYNEGSATIEIILKCERPGESVSPPYVTIKRVIRRIGDFEAANDWYINGNITNQKAVIQLATNLGTQISNLCQFLPQDKVSEFATMTPEKMLEETMKAAASEETFNQFNELVELRKQERSLAKSLENDTKELENDQRNMNKLEDIRRQALEREERRKRVDLLKKKRPWILYNNERNNYLALKEQYENLKREIESATFEADQELYNEMQRVQDAIKQSSRRLKQLSSKVRSSRRIVETMHAQSQDFESKIEAQKNQIVEHREMIAKAREKNEKYRRDIRQVEEEMTRLRGEMESGEMAANVEAADREYKRISEEIKELDSKLVDLKYQKDRITEKSSKLRENETKIFKQIEDVRNVHKRKLEKIKALNQDTYAAYTWLQGNKGHFKGTVIGPIGLEMTVKDEKMAQAVESVISRSIQFCFVSDNSDDYDEFARICEENGWKTVNSILLQNIPEGSALPSAPWSRRELNSLGFDCVVSDLIEGPPLIIWALHENAKVHLIPVCLSGGSNKINIPACERTRNIMKFVSRDSFHEIRHSRYNDGGSATRSAPLKPGALLTLDLGASNSDLSELQKKIDSIRQKLNDEQLAMRNVLEKLNLSESALEHLKQRKEECGELRKAALVKKAEFKKKEIAFAQLRKEIRDTAAILQGEGDELEYLEALRSLIHQRSKLISTLRESLKRLNEEIISAGLEDMENRLLNLQLSQLEALRDQKRGLHENLRSRLEVAESDLAAAKERAKNALQIAGMEQLSEDSQEKFASLPDDLEVLDTEIREEEARLRAAGSGDRFGQQDLDELERKTLSIRELSERIKETGKRVEEFRRKIEAIRPVWRERIDEMIAKINEKFQIFMSKLNNGGRVELGIPSNPFDFDAYFLVILVKFRAGEQLQRLTGQRQSGGEKSVSTILYLMSLQELTRSPFRVVDEINQGMDVINERKVHALMVETATTLHGRNAQYFLITPKLLTGLEYNEKMHILCIYNGPGVLH